MNFSKILQVMPFILAGLIVILICLIVIGGLDSNSSGDKKQETAAEGNETTLAPTKEPVDWGANGDIAPTGEANDDNNQTEVDVTPTPDEDQEEVDITPAPTDAPEPDNQGTDNEFGFVFTEKHDFVDTKNGVNLRAGCSTDTEIVAYLEIGKRLERTGYNAEWTRVIYNDMECYVSTPLIVRVVNSIDEQTEEQNNNGNSNEYGFTFEAKSDYVDTKDDVNLRSGASIETAIAAYLEKGKRLKRTGYNAEWTRVEYEGKTCYIATRLIVKVSATATDEVQGNTGTTETQNTTENNGTTENQNTTENAENTQNTENNETTETTETTENNTENTTETVAENNTEEQGTPEENTTTEQGTAEDGNTDGGQETTETNNTDTTEDATGSTLASGGIFFGSGSGKLICIDPGHQTKGNYNTEPVAPGSSEKKAKVSSGTSGKATGLPEYKLNLTVAMKLKDELVARGYRVVMTRTTNDVDISNIERATIANNNNVDAFIRVHANGNDNTSVYGIETICQTKNNKYNGDIYNKCKKLSECVLDGMVDSTGGKKRYVWETDTMSGINWSKVPVTIVEMGYMTNSEEDKKLSDESYQKKIVNGIANGVDKYFK
ncbi:MAG: N-acetylmuramoyl-L-alanine amidase [Lachnospiraceae bacterium]|nr:N-acetylmuramoyl-L-alanine amidase [Lachnospiraceae bacterium]